MTIKQISIFLENKKGRIQKALNTLAQKQINIKAITIANTNQYGILRLIVTDPQQAIQTLQKNQFTVEETEVIIINIPDQPNQLNQTLETLDQNNINIKYLYTINNNEKNQATIVIKTTNTQKTTKLLKKTDTKILEKKDIPKL